MYIHVSDMHVIVKFPYRFNHIIVCICMFISTVGLLINVYIIENVYTVE